ncbi:MAG: SRPBCC family protein [Taibaiella sp.]|nr:SRPBCC family protein [Taibaiella sp.]
MNILKIVFACVAIIIAIPFFIALFVKNEYIVEREITIDKPQAEIFNYIKLLRNQDNYNQWMMVDPNAKKVYTGTDGTEGFTIAWDSENKNLGKGEQVIKKIHEGKGVDLEIRFIKPFENVAQTPISTDAITPTQTKVKWTFSGRNKYPMNLMNLFIDKMLGKDLATSLGNLKSNLEQHH